MLPDSHGVLAICRSQALSKIHDTIYPYLTIVKRDEIVRARDRRSNETVTLRKHVTKHKKHAKMDGGISQKIRGSFR